MKEIANTILVECAWEVCNQVGGIYTVIRSKVPEMMKRWDSKYCLLGPSVHPEVNAIFDPIDDYDNPFGRAVLKMRDDGYDVMYGEWLITGRPQAVLVNPANAVPHLNEIKYYMWEKWGIATPSDDELINEVICFGYMMRKFFAYLCADEEAKATGILGHFHEWMASSAVPDIIEENPHLKSVFTTHATMLGRYLAGATGRFYNHLPFFDWQKEASHFGIEPQVRIEREAAQRCDICTTVSEVTARECKHLLGVKPHVILPNGLNIQRFEVLHQVQNLHQECKDEIHRFVMGHFFQSYTFDLDNTLYFFTSGRYEYKNKGYDLTLEALNRLNKKMKRANIDKTVVMFFITKRPVHSINAEALSSRGTMEEVRRTCDTIVKQVEKELFFRTVASDQQKVPDLNEFVDDYWKLRLRRNLQSWKTGKLPVVVTHDLVDKADDDIVNYLNENNLKNSPDDKVKIVYHPDFIAPNSPLFGIDYAQFVRGCHLGIFPSYYEPWGYTPLECIARGVAAVTADLSGFGDFVLQRIPDHVERGLYVVERGRHSFDEAAQQLADNLFDFVQLSRRERIDMRNKLESTAEDFDWQNLILFYEKAYQMALTKHKKD